MEQSSNMKNIDDVQNQPAVAVVIAVHNAIAKTKRCLESLGKINYGNYEIYLVDDGSSDGTSDVIRKEFPEVHLIQGNGKLYWSGGYNAAIIVALKESPDYVLLLNNDGVVNPDFLSQLVEKAGKDSIVGSKVMSLEDPQKVFSFGHYNHWYRGVKPDFIRLDDLKEVEAMSGNSILVPRQVFDRGIYLDESFPMVYGDLDFCLRAREQGFRCYVTGASVIWNEVGHTSNRPRISGTFTQRIVGFLKFYFSIFSLGNPFLATRFYWRHARIKPLFFLPVAHIYFSYFLNLFRKMRAGFIRHKKTREADGNG